MKLIVYGIHVLVVLKVIGFVFENSSSSQGLTIIELVVVDILTVYFSRKREREDEREKLLDDLL